MTKYFHIVAIIILLSTKVYPQVNTIDTTRFPFVLGIRAHYGEVIIHSRSVRAIKDSYPVGLELDFSWHKNRQKQWDHCHCYPRVGLMLTYYYYDNPEVLGNGYNAVYYVEPFFGAYRKLNFSMRAGAGLTYLTRPYDEVTNPDNMSYSTHLSSFLLLYFTLNYQVNEKTGINLSACYNHTSNGGIKEPNKGINFPTASLGFDYTFNPSAFINRDKSRFRETGTRKTRLDIDLLGTAKSIRHGEPVEHIIWGGSVSYSYQVGRLNALIAGAEWMVNGLVKEIMIRNEITGVDHQRGGLLAGHEFLMGRYNFCTLMGVYVYRPYKDNDNTLYQRYKLTYRINKWLYTGICVKAHRHVADYFDIRLGFYFKNEKERNNKQDQYILTLLSGKKSD